MKGGPFYNEALRLVGKRTLKQRSFKSKRSPIALVPGMKVRGRMIVVKHLDPDSKKSADLWHRSICLIAWNPATFAEP